MKSLVVYYSRTGNAKFVAETIAAELGSDLEEIVDLKKREGKLGWLSAGKDSSGEKLTEIAPTKRSPAEYDLVVVGTPIWAWRPTPAIRTYLKQNDLSEKKAALFFTLDGSPKQCVEKTKAIMPNCTIISELVIPKPLENKEDSLQKIADWCNALQKQL
jgi:flavodoxin